MKRGYRTMREQETAFIGKITAGVTHEFMNVLSTIKEASGLMEDLLAEISAGRSLDDLDKKTLRRICTRANAVGALTCTRAGAIPGLPTRTEVDQFLSQAGGI